MKTLLRNYIIGGICFVSVIGTLLHFVYEWTGKNPVIGLIAPVNESVWEHIKLLFFPMLFYHMLFTGKLKDRYDSIRSAGHIGLLLGSISIPVLFYVYSGILGKNFLALDIATFLIGILIGFLTQARLAKCSRPREHQAVFCLSVIIFACALLLFTYYPPGLALFVSKA